MLYNETSSFDGHEPDSAIIINDVSLKDLPAFAYYNEQISKGNYAEASTYLNSLVETDTINASLFNMLQNRISSTQSYIVDFPDGYFLINGEWVRPFNYGETEPTPVADGITIWLDDEILNYK